MLTLTVYVQLEKLTNIKEVTLVIINSLDNSIRPQKKHKQDDEGEVETVDFYETTDDTNIRYEIKANINDKLTVDFYLECEKINA
jgi:hypothetical protein